MAVVPAKRARLRRARAEPGPSNHRTTWLGWISPHDIGPWLLDSGARGPSAPRGRNDVCGALLRDARAPNFLQHRQNISPEPLRVLAHREMPELAHDRHLGA